MDFKQPPMTLANGRKRRRVPRACDECRQNKVKCDGKKPCLLCISHEFECTYDRPSCRVRKLPAISGEGIERRLRQIETTLNALVDRGLTQIPISKGGQHDSKVSASSLEVPKVSSPERHCLEVTLDASGRLEIDEDGRHNFHGHSSGFAFLPQIRQKYEDLLSPDKESGNTAESQLALPQIFDSRQSFGIPVARVPPPLPSKTVAGKLVEYALECVCSLSRVVHRPTFDFMFNRVYDLKSAEHGVAELRFLPLLYAVMAVGCFGSSLNNDETESKRAMAAGVEFYLAAKRTTDVTECQDITSLQTIVFIVAFLQCSSRMSSCYTYLGIAMKSAIRMGLHRRVDARFSPIEQQTRRRVFWVIRKMDVYVSTMLGLPGSIADDDFDQELPLDLDDSCILADQIVPQPYGSVAPITATNAHVRLMSILKKITTFVYPIKGAEQRIAGKSRIYFVDHSRVHEIEIDLRTWLNELPECLKSPVQGSERLASYLLRISYYHVRLLLYRPFTHYLSDADGSSCSEIQPQAASAAACLSAAKHIVHIAKEMKGSNLLAPGHWFALYATFFAVFSLVYFVLENPLDARAPAVFEDANLGRELLVSLHDCSPIVERCSVSLKILFERLPDALARRLRETSLQTRHGASPKSKSSSPEYGLTIATDYLQVKGSPGKQHDNPTYQTQGFSAAMPVSLNFATGSAPQSMGSSFKIEPGGYLLDSLGPPLNLDARNLNQGKQFSGVGGSEGVQSANPGATPSHWIDSLATLNHTVAGVAPYLHHPNGATLPAERGVPPSSNTPVLSGFPDLEVPNAEQDITGLDYSAPEQHSCGDSWSSYGFGDGLLQADAGTDINLAYFFNEYA